MGRWFSRSFGKPGEQYKEIVKIISFFFAAMFYVYILYSHKSDRYYIGHTTDVSKHLNEHNNPQDKAKYSAKHLPWELVLSFPVSESRGEAMLVEKFVKNQKSRVFIKKLLDRMGNMEFFSELIANILK